MLIRRLTGSSEDTLKLLPIWRFFSNEGLDVNILGARIAISQAIVLVLDNNGTFQGFAACSLRHSVLRQQPWLELDALFVAKELRRSLWGSQLLKNVCQIALEEKCDAVHVSSIPEPAAEAFYRKNGFRHYATRWVFIV